MAAVEAQHQPADDGRGEALRPRQQGGAALQEYVDAGARALDVRPRSPAAHRLAQCEIREGARSRGGERRGAQRGPRSEEHTSELQSLMRSSYAVFCLKNKTQTISHLH